MLVGWVAGWRGMRTLGFAGSFRIRPVHPERQENVDLETVIAVSTFDGTQWLKCHLPGVGSQAQRKPRPTRKRNIPLGTF